MIDALYRSSRYQANLPIQCAFARSIVNTSPPHARTTSVLPKNSHARANFLMVFSFLAARSPSPIRVRERTAKPKPIFTPFVRRGKCLGPATS